MAGGVLMILRSWALRHCSAPWFLLAKRKYKERRAPLTACGEKQKYANVGDGENILLPGEFPTLSGNLPLCEVQTPLSASSRGGHTPRPSDSDEQNWGHWKKAEERGVTGLL